MATSKIERPTSKPEDNPQEFYKGYSVDDLRSGRSRKKTESDVDWIKYVEAMQDIHSETIEGADRKERLWSEADAADGGGADYIAEKNRLIAKNKNNPEYKKYLEEKRDAEIKALKQKSEQVLARKEEEKRVREEERQRNELISSLKSEDHSMDAVNIRLTPEEYAKMLEEAAKGQREAKKTDKKPWWKKILGQ